MSWHLSEKRVYVRADDDDRIICAMGAGTTNAEAHLLAAAPDLYVSLSALMADIENGILVRDVSGDGEPGYAVRMLPFVKRLQVAAAALGKAEGGF